MTLPTQLVLRVLLADPQQELYGIEIGDAAGLPSGTIHPMLARLESIGWLESRWEQIDPRSAGRPARRYYKLSAAGADLAQHALAEAYRPRSTPRAAPPPLGQPG
jgi:DNA-binding PadR family transcriptional regulator